MRRLPLVLLPLLAACVPKAPLESPSVEPLPTMGRPTKMARPTATPTVALEEQPLGTPAPSESPLPAGSAGASPPPTRTAAPTGLQAEPGSLLGGITATTPPNVSAALRLIEDGREQMRRGRFDLALDRFERSVTIDPTNAYGYYFLAQLHYRNKDYDQAIAFANRAVVLSARLDRSWLSRSFTLQGTVFEEVGRFPDARKAYQKAVQADPGNLVAQTGLARLTVGH